jgi:hypothetical protein
MQRTFSKLLIIGNFQCKKEGTKEGDRRIIPFTSPVIGHLPLVKNEDIKTIFNRSGLPAPRPHGPVKHLQKL